jgi:hypothetical protein
MAALCGRVHNGAWQQEFIELASAAAGARSAVAIQATAGQGVAIVVSKC